MPLLRLWNSLRGRSSQPAAGSASNSEKKPAKKPKPPSQKIHPSGTDTRQAGTSAAKVQKPARPKARKLGIFRGGPHAALCRQLKSISASSVLEIGVDDGSRAVAVVQMLSKRSPVSVRYAAVDEFEMAGGTVSLKRFFQSLRAADISPRLFPDPIDRGLLRVAHTIGPVDLILIAAPAKMWQTPHVEPLLARLCHAETTVLYRDEQENWLRYQPASIAQRWAA